MRWHLIIDHEGMPGAVNMAVDQALLDAAQHGDGYLRLYRWEPPCLSFGRNEPARRRYDVDLIQRRNLDTVRRPTGGRAVWHEAEVTYAVAAPVTTFGTLRETYSIIHEVLSAALNHLGAVVHQAPQSSGRSLNGGSCFAGAVGGEIVAGGRKLVGSAQLREGTAFLQHGSILLEDGQDVIAEVSRQPHGPIRATSLSEILQRPVDFNEACAAITRAARSAWHGTWLPTRASTPPDTCYNFDDSAWTWKR